MRTKQLVRKRPILGTAAAVALAISTQASATDYDHLFWFSQTEAAYAPSSEEGHGEASADPGSPGEDLIWYSQTKQAYAPSSQSARVETHSRDSNAFEHTDYDHLFWFSQTNAAYAPSSKEGHGEASADYGSPGEEMDATQLTMDR